MWSDVSHKISSNVTNMNILLLLWVDLLLITSQNQPVQLVLTQNLWFWRVLSYPGHLGQVCVHVLVADRNHLPDASVVTEGKNKQVHPGINRVRTSAGGVDSLVNHLLIGGNLFCVEQLVARRLLQTENKPADLWQQQQLKTPRLVSGVPQGWLTVSFFSTNIFKMWLLFQ